MSISRTRSEALMQLIDARAADLREKIRSTLPKPADEETLERTGLAQDQVDLATTTAEDELNHTMHERYLQELRQVDAARERAANGLLDCCSECGGEIGYERLRAQPFAVRCVECQSRHERKLDALRR
jgi:RNA polymerase-binding transcription factor DksA